MTIDGQAHTYITNAFVEEAEGLIAALVEKKEFPASSGRVAATSPEFSDDARGRKNRREATRLGIVDIWLAGKIEEADRTYRPSSPTF